MMRKSYFLELESKRAFVNSSNEPVKSYDKGEAVQSDSRLSFTSSLRSKKRELLSKIVWKNNHSSFEASTVKSHLKHKRHLDLLPDIKHSFKGRDSSSYNIELASRKVKGIGATTDEPPKRQSYAPVLILSPATSSLPESDWVDESLPEEYQEKRKFISLRGLPNLASGKVPTGEDFENLHVVSNDCDNSSYQDNGLTESQEATFFLTLPPQGHAASQEIGFEDNSTFSTQNSDLTDKMKGMEVVVNTGERTPHREKIDGEIQSKDASTEPYLTSTKTQELRSVLKTPTQHNIRLTPHYPFETGIRNKRRMNRTAIHNGLLRSTRMQDHSHPSVVSSTQQLLCLTPSKGGVITLGSEKDIKEISRDHENSAGSTTIQVKRFNENETPVPLAATIVTRTTGGPRQGNSFFRIMQQGQSARPRTSGGHGNAFSMAQLHYKHTTQIRKPYRYPALSPTSTAAPRQTQAAPRTPNYERNATSMSITKHPANTAYRIIESHVKWNRKWPVFSTQKGDNVANVYPYQSSFMVHNSINQARKMAPVLRVIPAFPNAPKAVAEVKRPKSITETEGASQKKVRFTDQVGLPLVRNATPNYRRKHSYILRWLETAGRPIKTVPLV